MLLVNITDQVSQPYRTHRENRVVHILILTFFTNELGRKKILNWPVANLS